MGSIIEGYNYDIFISYRQKDNRHDGWVTEFVNNLKGELESTFKEEISVYYDMNPHDGLLDTHDVDASLKEKLKCLIFIPILSRTYCDPKSFAWEHEFKAFANMATHDKYGLKIALPDGNVANRILPVRIHDLDREDIKACESLIGGHLRGVDFIYKSAGVNRPLRSKEDKPLDNLDKTIYLDQINRVTLAIRAIRSALKGEHLDNYEAKRVASDPETGFLQEKSIIVLPFENISTDADQEYFSDGLTEEIINELSHVKELMVISRSSAMTYKGTRKKISEIARDVRVHYVLEGSVRKAGNNLRITVQLIDAASDSHLWAKKYTGTLDDIFDIQEKVSQSVVESLKMKFSATERDTTGNSTAYDLYLLGRYHWNKRTEEGLRSSIQYFEKAIAADDTFTLAYCGLADSYFICGDWNYLINPDLAFVKSKEYALKALSLNSNLAEAYATLAGVSNYFEFNYGKAEELFQNAYKLNPNYATAYQWNADLFARTGRFEEAKVLIRKAIALDPVSAIKRYNYGLILYHACEFDGAKIQFDETLQIDPLFPKVIRFQLFLTLYMKGHMTEAADQFGYSIAEDELHKEYMRNLKDDFPDSEPELLKILIDFELKKNAPSARILSILYTLKGDKNKALDYLEYNVRIMGPEIRYLNVEPVFRILHSEPRFIALVKRMRLLQNT